MEYKNRFKARWTFLMGKEPEDALGPDLLAVTRNREKRWLLDWLKAPEQMLKKEDPIATALYEPYNKLTMPNLRLNQQEAHSVLDYIDEVTERIRPLPNPELNNP